MNTPSRYLRSVAALALTLLAAHSPAATFLWNVATPGPNNWNVNANWSPNTGNPGATDTAIFGTNGLSPDALTANNVVSVNTVLNTLQYTNGSTGTPTYNVTQIPAGVTLTVTNNFTETAPGAVNGYLTYAAMFDAGTFLATGATFVIGDNASSTGAGVATLDLSGLSNFVYSSATGTLNIGGTGNRGAGSMFFAAVSNSITAATFSMGASGSGSSSGGTCNANLGGGTNLINATNVNIIAQKENGSLQFQGSTGGLRIRGASGADSDRANMVVGNRNVTGTGTTTGNVSVNGHTVDMKLNTLTIGQETANAAGVKGVGNFSFDTGTVDATTINMAVCSGNATATATSSLTNGGGTLLAGSISLVNQTLGTGSAGTLTINGGTVNCAGSITKATSAGTGTINVNNAALIVNGSIGINAGGAVDALNLNNSTLTLAVVNGSPSVTATTLTLSGATDIINISAAPAVGVFPSQFPVITYTPPLNGTFDFVLGTLPGTLQGYISNNVANNSVDLVITNSMTKADIWNGNLSPNWDVTTLNWRYSGGSANYQQGDLATFDESLSGTPNVNLALNVLPGGVTFSNSTHSYVLSGPFKISGITGLVKLGSGSATLAENGDDFIGGITVNNGTLILDNTNSAITGGTSITGGTLQIGNADTNGGLPGGPVSDDGALVFKRTDSVLISTAINGSGSLTQNGSGTLTLSGVNGFTGLTTVGNGTLALTGAGSLASSSGVAVNSATLDLSALPQTTTLNGLTLANSTLTVAVNASASTNIVTTSLTFGAGPNHLNVASLPAIASYPVTFTIIQAASPAGGTFNLSLGTLPAATPAYAGNVSQSADLSAVLLTLTSGPVGVRPTVGWSGADVPNLNTNWSDRLNWQLPGAPTFGDNVLFNDTAAQSASALSSVGGGAASLIPDNLNNFVDANFTVSSLTYTNLGGATFHNTFINSGKTLTLTNAGLIVGGLDSGSAQQAQVSISGANSALSVAATNGNVQVWVGSGSVSGSQATLDLSALDNFSANVSRLLVGATIGNVVNRPSGILYLAKTNTITARFQTTTIEAGTTTANASIVVGDCNQNSGSDSSIYLGQVNTISADTIGIGRQKAPGHFSFNPLYANTAPYPTVTFQGFSSSQVSTFDVADAAGNTGSTSFTADTDLSGGIVTATVDTMNVGRASSGGTGAQSTTGSFTFDAGTITVNTLNVGLQPAAILKSGIGTFSVNSNTVIGTAATLVVRGNLNLGNAAGGAGANTTSGTLNITNGTVWANAIVPGTNSTSTNILAGGRLFVTNAVGNTTAQLSSLSLAPLNTPDNFRNDLYLPVGLSSSGMMVTNLDLDGLDTTTNVINIESVGPVGSTPVELPLIQYTTMNFISGSTFNLGLGKLPTGYAGFLTNDTTRSMVALVLTAAIHPQPVINSITQSGTNLVISGINGFANRSYNVLATTNVTLPQASWAKLTTGVFSPTGTFTFTTPVNPAQPAQFLRLQVQ